MPVRTEILKKWLAYAGAALAAAVVQGLVLQRLRVFGVMPFVYPLLAALIAMLEGSVAGTAYCVAFGAVCDLTMYGPLPCFYTLAFPLAGLCAGLISENWLPAGLPCSFVVSALSFVITDGFRMLLLALTGKAAWAAAFQLSCRELAAALFLVPFCYLFLRAVHRRVRIEV